MHRRRVEGVKEEVDYGTHVEVMLVRCSSTDSMKRCCRPGVKSSAGNMGRAQLGQPEHGPKTGAQNTAQHEIIRAGLARPEERAGPCLESRPVVPPTRPARAGRAWAGPARNGPSKSPRGRIEDPVADADSSNLAAAFIPHRETRPVAPSCSGAEP